MKDRDDRDTMLEVTIDENGLIQRTRRVPILRGETEDGDHFVVCSKCNKRIHRSDIRQHHRNVHDCDAESGKDRFSFLHRRSSAKPPAVKCPHCPNYVRRNRLERHMRKAHGETVPGTLAVARAAKVSRGQKAVRSLEVRSPIASEPTTTSKRPLVQCPYCQSDVREDRLEKHKRKVHGTMVPGAPAVAREGMDPVRLSNHTRQKASRQSGHRRPGGSVSSQICSSERLELEKLKQSQDEPRDGSKYWGHVRREYGRFGSHPLMDDYGDESEP